MSLVLKAPQHKQSNPQAYDIKRNGFIKGSWEAVYGESAIGETNER